MAFAIGVGLMAALHTGGRIFDREWIPHVLWFLGVLVLAGRLTPTPSPDVEERPDDPGIWAPAVLGMALYAALFSSLGQAPQFFFTHWAPSPDAGAGFRHARALTLSALSALLVPLCLRPPRRAALWLGLWLALAQGLCLAFLWRGTGGGHALYRDDHASMLFRFWEFTRTYPQVLNYDPYWNAGSVDYAGAACGVNGLGVLYWPVWARFPVEAVFTPLVGLTFVVLIPMAAAMSLRLVGGSWTAAWCAGLLGLGVSRDFFIWGLHFGTVGACFASAAVLPTCACLYRVVHLGHREPWLGVLLTVCAFSLLSWGLSMLMAACLLLTLLVSIRRLTWPTWRLLLICGLALALAYYRTVGVLVFHGGELFRVMQVKAAATGGGAHAPDLAWVPAGCRNLAAALRQANPVLVFLGLGGLAFLPDRGLRVWLWPLVLALAFVTGWGAALKPHMELSRMSILLLYVSVIPAALTLDRLLSSRPPWLAGVRASLVALLLLGGWNVARIYGSDPAAPYAALGPASRDLAAFLRAQTPPDGRVLFAGRTVHFYGDHGHVAPLAYLAGREMLACDYYHFRPSAIEYEYPPGPFRRPVDRVPEFLDLYNVMVIVTRQANWKAYFRRSPELYAELQPQGDITVFRPRRASSLFLKGQGTVTADFNRLEVAVANAAEEVVLKYAWADQLEVAPPAELFPFEVADGHSLLGVRPHGKDRFTIRFRSPW